MAHDMRSHARHRPAPHAAVAVLSRRTTTEYRCSQRTARPAAQVLDDLAALRVPEAVVSERGGTYLVFAPQARRAYGPGRAVVMSGALAVAVLVLAAANVVLVALLPAAVIPLLPLLLDDVPTLAVGAVPEGPDCRVTVHGRAWADLGAALDAYLTNLPGPTKVPEPSEYEEHDLTGSAATTGMAMAVGEEPAATA